MSHGGVDEVVRSNSNEIPTLQGSANANGGRDLPSVTQNVESNWNRSTYLHVFV